MLIAGDINMPQIDWITNYSHAPDGHFTRGLIEGIQECDLIQHVTKSTRYRAGERPSTLDVVMMNEEGLVKNLAFLPPVGNSDYVTLRFDVTCYAQITKSTASHLNFDKGNYQRLNDMIRDATWGVVQPADAQGRYENFKVTLNRLVSRCIPKACPKGKRRNLYMNRETLRLKNRKRKLWTTYMISRDDISHSRYVRCKNDLRRLTRRLRNDFEQKFATNLKNNPKAFWRYAGSRMKT